MLSWTTKLQASPWHGDHSLLFLVCSYTSCFRTCQKHPKFFQHPPFTTSISHFRVLRSRKEPLMVYTRLTAQASLSFGKPWQTMRILKAILTQIRAAIPVSLQERKQFLSNRWICTNTRTPCWEAARRLCSHLGHEIQAFVG